MGKMKKLPATAAFFSTIQPIAAASSAIAAAGAAR
jgi:hypothetical protein